MEPCRICDVLLTAPSIFHKHCKSDKIEHVFVKFEYFQADPEMDKKWYLHT